MSDSAPVTDDLVEAPAVHTDARASAPQTDDADRLAAEPPTKCLNCGSVLPGHYCPDCGQRDQPIQQPAHTFIAESVSEYFGLDGRLWRSLGALLFKPGALTEAYLQGRRTHYLRPLRLYLSASLAFFFALSFLDTSLGEPRREVLAPLPADSLVRAEDLSDRLDEARSEIEDQQALLDADSSTALGRVLIQTDAVSGLDVLRDSVRAARRALDALDEDSLVQVSTVPEPARSVLVDSLEVTRGGDFQLVGDDGLDQVPSFLKGRMVERLERASSDRERALIQSEMWREFLSQIPTALFVVLPLFALLLKLFYLSGSGRTPRLRPRPEPPAGGASWWARTWHPISNAWWTVGRLRGRWRRHRRRKLNRNVQARRIRGAPRRALRWLKVHPLLRRWRVRRIRLLRRSLVAPQSRYYSEHLVFALHVHAFTFVALLPLLFIGPSEGSSTWQDLVANGLLISIPLYFLVAQHRVYRESWPKTLFKSSVLGIVYGIVIIVGTVVAAGLALRLG